MEDVDKLDNIQDCFIHYQLLRFCQATRLQYLNGQVQPANQQVLQQQHVDHKIANALLKKGTREAYKKWNLQDRAWVDMRLHESHDEGGFGVPNNTISRHAAAYTTNARFVAFLGTFARPAQEVWLPGNDIQDPTTWSVPSLRTLKHLHENLLQAYDCTERPVANQPAQPSGAGGSAAANAGAPPPPPPARAQDASSGTLVLPQLNRLHEAYKRRQDALPASSTSQDQQPTASGPIPSQRRLTQQLTAHWPQFKALRQRYAGTRFEEQRMLHMPQKHKATVPDSTLRIQTCLQQTYSELPSRSPGLWWPRSGCGRIVRRFGSTST